MAKSTQLVGDNILSPTWNSSEKAFIWASPFPFLVKVDQIGSLTETLDAVELAALGNRYTAVISHRCRRNGDAAIADIAVRETNAGQIGNRLFEPFRPYRQDLQPPSPD